MFCAEHADPTAGRRRSPAGAVFAGPWCQIDEMASQACRRADVQACRTGKFANRLYTKPRKDRQLIA